MSKKSILSSVILLATVILGTFLWFRGPWGSRNNNNESVIDSLKSRLAESESLTDSLFLVRAKTDTMIVREIREVTKYRYRESLKYLTEHVQGLDSIRTNPADSTVTLGARELVSINRELARIPGMSERIRVDSLIIQSLQGSLETSKEALAASEAARGKDRKRGFRKGLGIGAVLGAIVTLVLL